MRFARPRMRLLLAKEHFAFDAEGGRTAYRILQHEPALLTYDVYYVESGLLEPSGFHASCEPDDIIGVVTGVHLVDWRDVDADGAQDYTVLQNRYRAERRRRTECNFAIVDDRVGIFDDAGVMHTVLRVEPLPTPPATKLQQNQPQRISCEDRAHGE